MDDIFNKEKNKAFGDSDKTVVFVHKACKFDIEESILEEADYIKQAEKGYGTEKSEPYYLQEMRKAAATDKKFIIMEFDPFICDVIETLITRAPGQYNLCHWGFYIFFHADSCPSGEEDSPLYNLNDEKLAILRPLYYSEFFYKYTMPIGHTLTLEELKKLKNGIVGPETTVEEFQEYVENFKKGILPEPLFEFYEIDRKKMKEYINRKMREGIKRHHIARQKRYLEGRIIPFKI